MQGKARLLVCNPKRIERVQLLVGNLKHKCKEAVSAVDQPERSGASTDKLIAKKALHLEGRQLCCHRP